MDENSPDATGKQAVPDMLVEAVGDDLIIVDVEDHTAYSLTGDAKTQFLDSTSNLGRRRILQAGALVGAGAVFAVAMPSAAASTSGTVVVVGGGGNPVVVADSGFETPVLGLGQFSYNTAGSPWTFSGYSGISGNNSAFTNGITAPEGVQVGLIQSASMFPKPAGSISQTVSGFSAASYTLTVAVAKRDYQGGSSTFQFLLDNAVVGTPVVVSSNSYSDVSFTFTATAGSHLITFTALPNSSSDDTTTLLDNVRIA